MTLKGLAAFVHRRMKIEELEPAAWLGGNAYPKGAGVDTTLVYSRELREYAILSGQLAFRKQVAALLAHHCYWGIEPLRTPVQLAFGVSRERLVTFLMGCDVLGSDPDSGAYLVAEWRSVGRATSPVASFLFNDVMPDEEPGDFVVEARSIRDAIMRGGRPRGRPNKRSVPCRDLARRYRRGIWLAQVFQGDDWDGVSDNVDEIARTARDAAPWSAYERERRSVAMRPDLAAYWLLALAVRDDRDALQDVLERTIDTPHAAIKRLRKLLAPITRGERVIEAEWKKRRRGVRGLALLRAAIA